MNMSNVFVSQTCPGDPLQHSTFCLSPSFNTDSTHQPIETARLVLGVSDEGDKMSNGEGPQDRFEKLFCSLNRKKIVHVHKLVNNSNAY